MVLVAGANLLRRAPGGALFVAPSVRADCVRRLARTRSNTKF
jgi:hypothetical protein